MRRILPAIFLMATAVALGTPDRKPSQQVSPDMMEGFDHRRHTGPLAKAGLTCSACHSLKGDGEIPGQSCHYCHGPASEGYGGESWQSPGRCERCHTDVRAPVIHGAGWLDIHGNEARVSDLQCQECHGSAFCVRCHEQKNAMQFSVHDRSWLSIHSVAARTNPAECSTCHLQTDCVACHATGDGRLK